MKIHWVGAKDLEPTVRKKIRPTLTCLDIGCGIKPQTMFRHSIHVCCEPFLQYVEKLFEINKKRFKGRLVIIQVDWAQAMKIFPPRSIDTIYLIDVIEHLPKKEGKKLIKLAEQIARKQIIIFTPYGFMPQEHTDGKDAWGMDGASMQVHLSGWEPKDFGDSWGFYATKEFHQADNLGYTFKKPYGAFYAVRNIRSDIFSIKNWKNNLKIDMNIFKQKVSRKTKRFLKLQKEE